MESNSKKIKVFWANGESSVVECEDWYRNDHRFELYGTKHSNVMVIPASSVMWISELKE